MTDVDLAPSDVQTYTNGRLDAGDAATQQMLTAALRVARNSVGWMVAPIQMAVTVELDGPDSKYLMLPTLKLVTLTSVTEDGTSLDVSTIKASLGDGSLTRRRVSLRKRSRDYWTDNMGEVTVVMDHGYSNADAADWREAVLMMVDQMSLVPVQAATGASAFGVRSERVDDVSTTWLPYTQIAESVLFSVENVLAGYRLPQVEFM